MEDELRCPRCKRFLDNPVLLPCFHALCLNCASDATGSPGAAGSHSSASSSTSSAAGDSVTSDPDPEHLDKVSLSSEADSGVVVAPSGSRPGSFAGTPSCQLPAAPPSVSTLTCPVCRKVCLFDERGARNLPKYHLVQSILERRNSQPDGPRCEMCDSEPRIAVIVCEQCAVHYCESCRELCHPARGPLAKHTLVKPKLPASTTTRPAMACPDHSEQLQFFCCTCKVPACQLCININRHGTHDVQPITGICKAQKVQLGGWTKVVGLVTEPLIPFSD